NPTVYEGAEIAVGKRHRAAEVFFHQRAEHKAEYHWRSGKTPQAHAVSQQSKPDDRPHIKRAIVDRIDADTDEYEHRWVEQVIGNCEQPHPQADQWNIEHYEKQVADPEAHDQAPEY